MSDGTDVNVQADPYSHLLHVLGDTANSGAKITHNQEENALIARLDGSANLWALIIDGDVVTSFRGNGTAFNSTLDLGLWLDEMIAWWSSKEEAEPPGSGVPETGFR